MMLDRYIIGQIMLMSKPKGDYFNLSFIVLQSLLKMSLFSIVFNIVRNEY